MIGEDGLHDRRRRASASPAWTPEERAPARSSRRCATRAPVGPEPYTPRRAALAPLGRRIEPLISLQWFCDMEQLAGPAIAVRPGRPRALPPRAAPHPGLPGLAGEHPALVHVTPALVGPPDPRLVPRRRRSHVGAEAPEGDGWERDPDVLDTWFSSGPVAVRHAGLARADRPAPRLLPHRRADHGRATSSSCGWPAWSCWASSSPARCRSPTCRSTPRSWPPTGAACPSRWAPASTRWTRSPSTAPTPSASACVAMASTQDVRFSADRVRQGLDLANKLWNASRLILLGVPEGAEPYADQAERSRTAGSCRGWSA